MKDIRGLCQFESTIVAKSWTSVAGDKENQDFTETESGNNATAEKRLKRANIWVQMLPMLVIGLLLSAAAAAVAQSTFGSVRGAVQDNTSAVISDTQVVLHSLDENTERTVNADASGSFILLTGRGCARSVTSSTLTP